MFDLSLEILRVVEDAAIASARTMGMGNPTASDQAAVESMRRCLDTLDASHRLLLENGIPRGTHAIARDITERKRAEARLAGADSLATWLVFAAPMSRAAESPLTGQYLSGRRAIAVPLE